MRVIEGTLGGVRLLLPDRFADDRGFFGVVWNRDDVAECLGAVDFIQENESLSHRVGTLRGLHFQAPPHAQAKLVRVAAGAALSVVVDARVGSPGFGRWDAFDLTRGNGLQLFVPRGFLHGFVTRAPDTLVQYKVDNSFLPEAAGSLRWNDPELAIDWGVGENHVTLSQKDRDAISFSSWKSPFRYEEPA